MYLENGNLVTNFSRRLLVGHPVNGPRTPGIPGLSEAQAEALDTLHEIGRRHELKQPMRTGDIRFVNNLAMMHRRDTYIDSAENHRHLLRLWLHNPDTSWNLPLDLQLAWERIFNDGERKESWHFVKFSPAGERYMDLVWESPGPKGGRDHHHHHLRLPLVTKTRHFFIPVVTYLTFLSDMRHKIVSIQIVLVKQDLYEHLSFPLYSDTQRVSDISPSFLVSNLDRTIVRSKSNHSPKAQIFVSHPSLALGKCQPIPVRNRAGFLLDSAAHCADLVMKS